MKLLQILIHNIMPLAVMIGTGMLVQRKFGLDIRTLSKLTFYLFSPAVIFKMLYEAQLTYEFMFQVLAFFAVFIVLLYGAAEIVIRLRRYQGGMPGAFRNSVIFYNSNNYGLPLNQLVFGGNPYTMAVQIIIMMMMNVLPFTYGIYSVNAHRMSLRQSLRQIAAMPVIYVIPAAFLLKWTNVAVPEPIYIPINYLADGFLAVALLTLGVQLASIKWNIRGDVLLSSFLRLCIAPALGALVVWAMGIRGEMAAALILSCAVPTSLTSSLLAVEFGNEPEFASQAVLVSTALSLVTIAAVIYVLGYVFGI
mgnify:CR=1 FL=1